MSEEFLEEELKTINWNEVDTYPLFPGCDENADKARQKKCFETSLHKHLNSYIQEQEFISNAFISDTLLINISISNKSEVMIIEISRNHQTFETFPDLENRIYESINMLPEVAPALKRGVPVHTVFTIPLVIKTEKL